MKYLKKKKFYELTKELLKDKKIPIMKECKYTFHHGAEWLCFTGLEDYHSYNIASLSAGNWISIEESFFSDEECEQLIVRCEIYAEPRDGKYTYHSIREYVKG